MISNAKELRSAVNSVKVAPVSLSWKEIKALAQFMTIEEKPLLLCSGTEGKIVLTAENLFIVTSKLFRSAKVKVVPLNSVKSAQEKCGLLLAQVTIASTDNTLKFSNLSKEASTKLIGFMREHENVSILPVKKLGIFEGIFKLTLIMLCALILKNATCGNSISDRTNKGQTAQENSSTHTSFTPVYKIVGEENLTLAGVPRFERRISVPLGLSTEELKQTLRDAAWKLQKDKNAVAAVIFAFREDDTKRDGGYTAGKCTVAPFGDWAKAVEVRSPSNLDEEILISEAYFDSTPIRPNGSKAFVNKNNTSLHRINAKQSYTDDVIAELKKGTEVNILESRRQFTLYGPLDMYKVQVKNARKKVRTGWVYGYDLSDTPNGGKVSVDLN